MKPLNPGLQVEDLQVQSVRFRDPRSISYEAHDQTLGTSVELVEFVAAEGVAVRTEGGALQFAPGRKADFEAGRQAFLQDARLVGRLDHPALPRVLRVLEANGTLYQVRPWRDGRSLAERLEAGEQPDADQARAVFEILTDALAYLHDHEHRHGAITPDRLLLDDAGRAFLRGFTGDRMDAEGPPWQAPERVDGEGATPRSDIYALAASLAAWVAGAPPPSARARREAQSAEAKDPIDRDALGAVEPLGDALRDGLSLDPDHRPVSMAAWRQGLDRVATRLRMLQDGTTPPDESERRPRTPLVLASLFTLFMVVVAAFLLSGRDVPVDDWLSGVDLAGERDRGPRIAPPTSEERARWEAALEADTLLAYRRFLEDFPTSVYAEQAQVQIDILDERAWNLLSAEDTRSAYVDYLDRFPTGLHQAEALQRIEAMDQEAARQERERVERERRDNAAWAEARAERTISAMDRYIAAWPAGLHIEEARRIRRALADRANDDRAFSTARELDTRAAYQSYLDAFPGGAHVTEALEAVERLTLAPGKPFRDCPLCPELRVMPVGAYRQGASPDDPLALEQENPQRVVTIGKPFAVGIFEVTFGQWDACVDDGGCSHRPPDNGWGRGDRPVIMVSWNDAQEYLAWLSEKTGQVYRLPSESEWEYVARADALGPWLGGTPEAVCDYGNVAGAETGFDWQHAACEDRIPAGTVPVGAFRGNRAGLFDVIGNVAEWTADCLNLSYLDAPTDGSAWTRGICSSHMTRGGSWVTGSRDIRLSSRFNLRNGDRNDFTGFRVLREIDE